MNENLIVSLKDIVVDFDGQKVLDGLSLDIHDKEFVTFLGPSGCGKTTTLRVIAGFVTPKSGNVFFDGKDIANMPPYKRPVNTVFQKYALFPHLNVRDNIAFGLKIKKMSRGEIDRRVDKMLSLVNLAGYGKRSVDSLSGGQQQRIAIARALVNEPDVLLLALEKVPDAMVVAMERVVEQGIPNVRFLDRDAELLPEMFAPGEISRLYINFPDPWPKKKQFKRRLTAPEFLDKYRALLPEGGAVWFKTDNGPLFDWSLESFRGCGWALADMPEGTPMTDYEARFTEMGLPIHRVVATRP